MELKYTGKTFRYLKYDLLERGNLIAPPLENHMSIYYIDNKFFETEFRVKGWDTGIVFMREIEPLEEVITLAVYNSMEV